MTSYPYWEKLVSRLEGDLESRESAEHDAPHDDSAWETMAEILRTRARLIIPHVGLQYSDIEDIAQSVLLKLQSGEAMRRLRAARSPEGYTFVMLRNAANDLARRRIRERNLFTSIEETEISGETAPDYARTTEQSSIVAKALELLTEEEMDLLRMRFWKDMSIAQIAAAKGISYSSVAVRLFRIIHRLRKQME